MTLAERYDPVEHVEAMSKERSLRSKFLSKGNGPNKELQRFQILKQLEIVQQERRIQERFLFEKRRQSILHKSKN